jgi:anti-anti-sigma regulatory factor
MEVIEQVEQQIRHRRYNIIFILNGVQSIDNYGVEALFSSMSMVKAWGAKVILSPESLFVAEATFAPFLFRMKV